MAIVAAAVIPHSPLILPSIAKEHDALFALTHHSLTEISELLYASQPDLVVLLTPHSSDPITTGTVVHVAETYHGDLVSFGDFTTSCDVHGSPSAAHRLKMTAEREHFSLLLQTHDGLDYGTSIPFLTVLQQLVNTPVLPIICTQSDFSTSLQLGQLLYEQYTAEHDRVVILASSDLSRRKRKSSGNPDQPTSEEKLLSQAMLAVDPSVLAATTPNTDTCGFAPIVTLLSALQQLHPEPKILSFQSPMGVGLLTAFFHCNG